MSALFTRHALNRMRRLRLGREHVEAVLAAPGWLEEEDSRMHVAWSAWQGAYLKVVYAVEEGNAVVITVGSRQRLPEGLK